jgi:hypothetical protein
MQEDGWQLSRRPINVNTQLRPAKGLFQSQFFVLFRVTFGFFSLFEIATHKTAEPQRIVNMPWRRGAVDIASTRGMKTRVRFPPGYRYLGKLYLCCCV